MNLKGFGVCLLLMMLLYSNIISLQAKNEFLNVLITNYQKDCKFCLRRETNGNFSFGQCPLSLKAETRFNLIYTERSYMYLVESSVEILNIQNQEEFYIFPLFSDKRMLISSAATRKCLTNILNNPAYDDTPEIKAIEDHFSDCDYSGASESQLFIFEHEDIFQFSKYNINLYLDESFILLSNLDYLRSLGVYFYLSYNGPGNQSLKYDLISNPLTIYLPSPLPNNQNYQVYGVSPPTTPGDYCTYDFSFRDIPYKTIPYYGGYRCFEKMVFELNISKNNNVVFKIRDLTNNLPLTTSIIIDGSTINFDLTSHTSSNTPYTYTNIVGLTSFTKSLEFGTYSLMLSVSNTEKWRYDAITFTINSCNYMEIEVPVYIKEYDITFRYKNDSKGTYIDNTILANLSNIFFNQSSGQNYDYLINNIPPSTSFILTMQYGTFYVSLTIANTATTEYVTQVVEVNSNKIFDIKLYDKTTPVTIRFYHSTKSEYVTTGFLPDNSELNLTYQSKNVGITKDTQLVFNLPIGSHNISLSVRYPLIMGFDGPNVVNVLNDNPINVDLLFSTIIFDVMPNGLVYMNLPSENTSILKNISWIGGGTDVKVVWHKIQVYPYSLDDIWVNCNDLTYTTKTGSIPSSQYGGSMQFASFAMAFGCESPNNINASAQVDLTGTPFTFKLGAESLIIPRGWMPNGSVSIQTNRKIAVITGGGHCGGTSPAIKAGTTDVYYGIFEYVPP